MVPKPIIMKTKDNFSQNGFIKDGFKYKSLKNNEFCLPVAIDRRIIPTKANAIPIEQINTYFHAASIECFVLLKNIRYALARVVASINTQDKPRFVLNIVPVIENIKSKTATE